MITPTIGFQQLLDSNYELYRTNNSKMKQTSITMLYDGDIKVAKTCFPTQPDDIPMNKVVIEPTPLCIIKFYKYLQKCATNIPTNVEALGLLEPVIADAD